MSILYLSWSPRLVSKRGLACTQAFGFIIYSANRVRAVMAHNPSGRVTSSWGSSLHWEEMRCPWESPSTSDSHALSPKLCLWACLGKNIFQMKDFVETGTEHFERRYYIILRWAHENKRMWEYFNEMTNVSLWHWVSCYMWWRLRGSQTTVRNI